MVNQLFIRIAFRSCIIGILRIIIFHYHEYLHLVFSSPSPCANDQDNNISHHNHHFDLKMFSTGAFSQLFSAYFFFSGVVFGSIMSQYRECETKVDDAVCAFHEYVDVVEVLYGFETTSMRNVLIEPARNFLKSWVKVLDQPPVPPRDHQKQEGASSSPVEKSSSPLSASPNHFLRELIENARTQEQQQQDATPVSTSLAADAVLKKTSPLTSATLKCVEKFRQSSHRVWTIRRTQVLEPAQLYLNIMLVVVIVCIFVVDWPSSPLIAEFVCVAGAASCSMLIHSLILELDDPFDMHPRSILGFEKIFLGLWKIICLVLFLDFGGVASTSVSLKAKRNSRNNISQEDDETSGIRISVKPLLEAASSRM